jgi:hypothetical protein
MEYFYLHRPEQRNLLAEDAMNPYVLLPQCPVSDHRSFWRANNPVVQVKHNKLDQQMIWLVTGPVVLVHADLLASFKKHGLTGYHTRPARVGFRNGRVSNDYSELMAAGWAGVARAESGIRLVEQCPGCDYKRYSGMESADQLIDWSQWSGDDFFVVWPLPTDILITKRVADLLNSLNVKCYSLGSLNKFENRNTPERHQRFIVGRMSRYLPQDVAVKYGKPLGLEE